MRFSALLAVSVCLLLSGCARLNNVMQTTEFSPNSRVFTYNDELQNVYIKDGRHGTRVCLHPTPDAAEDNSAGVSFSDATKADDADLEDASGVIALGGRNPEVLVARELMYRACELSLNWDVSFSEARGLYREFLGAVRDIAKYQTGVGSGTAVLAATLPGDSASSDAPSASSGDSSDGSDTETATDNDSSDDDSGS